ncbi:MAG: hypothetical protein B6D46_01465 [Polyangiaceae bacterium UTPRO1]|jgi:hypothetical protein|nr:hypothetical protein [Myxococcales bacterium]OQY69013.1 MAG: hypothetical protein B6D46_01465 [Polyangiaceae bacterium UTPRO1]
MRFTVTPDWRNNWLLRLVLVWFLVFVALLWITNALLYFAKMTLNPASVVAYYLGNEATFTQPRSYQGLLEITHFHLFAMGILVLTMTHLVLFVPMANRWKAWIVSLAFTTALADEAAGWLVRFVSPRFAGLKVAAFLGLEAVLAFMIGAVLWAICTAQPNDYRSSASDDDD